MHTWRKEVYEKSLYFPQFHYKHKAALKKVSLCKEQTNRKPPRPGQRSSWPTSIKTSSRLPECIGAAGFSALLSSSIVNFCSVMQRYAHNYQSSMSAVLSSSMKLPDEQDSLFGAWGRIKKRWQLVSDPFSTPVS